MKKMKNNKTFILVNEDSKYLLNEIGLPDLPTKLYGDLDKVSNRVLTTFRERPKNLGVLFSGLKGNSKTVCCLKICKEAEVPVILITEPFTGDLFKNFLFGLKGEYIIFIDEFEKVYNTSELQEEFLSILDGFMGDKKMFLFTSNSTQISQYLLNRPSRIFYHFKYDNLDSSIVEDIISQELVEKQFEKELRELLIILGTVSYDVLLNLVDEINRFKVSPKDLIKELNIQVEQVDFNVTLLLNGNRFTTKVDFNPLTVESFYITYKDENGYYRSFSDKPSNYDMYTHKGSFIYEGKVNKLIFTPFKPFKFNL